MPPPGYEPFLHAICTNPEDDTARLVYADWLDENGDPDRAEHIRLTIAVRRDPRADGWPDPRSLRAQDLLVRRRDEWTAELPGPAALWQSALWWYAGFPAVVSVVGSEQPFLGHAAGIVYRTPARALALALLQHPARALTALSACPQVAHFRTLLAARLGGFNDAAAEALAGGPHFAGLTQLRLPHGGIRDAGALALARSRYLGNLTELNLEGNPIGPAAAEALRARFGARVKLSAPG